MLSDNTASPQFKATTRLMLAEMDLFGDGGPIDIANARLGFSAVFSNNDATPQDRASAQLRLAEMDLFGNGGPVDYAKARQGFAAVVANNAAYTFTGCIPNSP